MRLKFECVDCGKFLGVYDGKKFYLTFSDIGEIKSPVKVICKECYDRTHWKPKEKVQK